MPIKLPEAKSNPADPLSNPPTFPEVTPRDLPVPLPNEQRGRGAEGRSAARLLADPAGTSAGTSCCHRVKLGSHREGGLAAPPSLGPNDTIQLGGHDEVVLVEALDLMGVKRHGRVAPAEGDVRVMALSLGQIGGTLHERKRLGEVLEPKRALDPVRVIETGTA